MKSPRTSLALILSALLAVLPAAAAADCYADYKAKRDNPLRLHYGVIALPAAACADPAAARAEIARRIGVDGWSLLTLESIFGPEGLTERQGNAGNFFLRY